MPPPLIQITQTVNASTNDRARGAATLQDPSSTGDQSRTMQESQDQGRHRVKPENYDEKIRSTAFLSEVGMFKAAARCSRHWRPLSAKTWWSDATLCDYVSSSDM